jgi:hypothetical protein
VNPDGDGTESIPAIPPDWSDMTNIQVSKFVESLGHVISSGVFPAPLAEELSAYRDKASEEIQARARSAEKRRAESNNWLPFRPVSMNGDGSTGG